MKILPFIFTSTALFLASSSLAQTNESYAASAPSSYSNLYISVGNISIDSKVARDEKVKDSATYWRLGWEKVNDKLVMGGGISGYQYSDKDKLNDVQVVDQFDNVSTASSDANATNLYFEAGYHHSLSQYFHLEMLGGYEIVTYSKRGFGNCSDCPGEDIDISGGLYVMPRISFTSQSWFAASLAYHGYLSGDVEGAYSLSLGLKF